MRKVLIIKNGRTPTTNSEWFEIAPPKEKEKHWKPYHSASELADYFLHYQGIVPPEIDEMLDALDVKADSFICEPECETYFPEDRFNGGGPRNHDLLMVGSDVVIGLEAKATETLDKNVSISLAGGSPTREERYRNICRDILSRDIEECSDVKYQLLSATLGTLLEAQRRNIKKAVVLVLLFDSKIVPEKHIENTQKDIDNFTNKLIQKSNGSYSIPYLPDIDFYVQFIKVKVCSYSN